VPSVDVVAGADNRGISPTLGAAVAEDKVGLRFDLILEHRRMGVFHRLLDSLGTQFAVAPKQFNFL
jgi:hypothetical protein